MRQKLHPAGSRNPHKRKKRIPAKSKGQISPQPSGAWPLERYDVEFWNWLEKINPNEVNMLSDAGRRALAVLLRTVLTQQWIGSQCGQRSIPRNIREQLRGVRGRLGEIAGHPQMRDPLLAGEMHQWSARIDRAMSSPPASMPVFPEHVKRLLDPEVVRAFDGKPLRRISSNEFRQKIAWPFFPPALFYAIEKIYKRESNQPLRREDFFELLSKLLPHHAQSADAASRWVYRFKKDHARVSRVESLVSTLLSTPVDK